MCLYRENPIETQSRYRHNFSVSQVCACIGYSLYPLLYLCLVVTSGHVLPASVNSNVTWVFLDTCLESVGELVAELIYCRRYSVSLAPPLVSWMAEWSYRFRSNLARLTSSVLVPGTCQLITTSKRWWFRVRIKWTFWDEHTRAHTISPYRLISSHSTAYRYWHISSYRHILLSGLFAYFPLHICDPAGTGPWLGWHWQWGWVGSYAKLNWNRWRGDRN